jgi:hypothetical protein
MRRTLVCAIVLRLWVAMSSLPVTSCGICLVCRWMPREPGAHSGIQVRAADAQGRMLVMGLAHFLLQVSFNSDGDPSAASAAVRRRLSSTGVPGRDASPSASDAEPAFVFTAVEAHPQAVFRAHYRVAPAPVAAGGACNDHLPNSPAANTTTVPASVLPCRQWRYTRRLSSTLEGHVVGPNPATGADLSLVAHDGTYHHDFDHGTGVVTRAEGTAWVGPLHPVPDSSVSEAAHARSTGPSGREPSRSHSNVGEPVGKPAHFQAAFDAGTDMGVRKETTSLTLQRVDYGCAAAAAAAYPDGANAAIRFVQHAASGPGSTPNSSQTVGSGAQSGREHPGPGRRTLVVAGQAHEVPAHGAWVPWGLLGSGSDGAHAAPAPLGPRGLLRLSLHALTSRRLHDGRRDGDMAVEAATADGEGGSGGPGDPLAAWEGCQLEGSSAWTPTSAATAAALQQLAPVLSCFTQHADNTPALVDCGSALSKVIAEAVGPTGCRAVRRGLAGLVAAGLGDPPALNTTLRAAFPALPDAALGYVAASLLVQGLAVAEGVYSCVVQLGPGGVDGAQEGLGVRVAARRAALHAVGVAVTHQPSQTLALSVCGRLMAYHEAGLLSSRTTVSLVIVASVVFNCMCLLSRLCCAKVAPCPGPRGPRGFP